MAGTALAAFLGSGVASAAVTAYANRNAAKAARRGTKSDAARDSLRALDDCYQGLTDSGRKNKKMLQLENAFAAEVDKCASAELDAAREKFVVVGRALLSGDLDTNQEDYQAVLHEMRSAIRQNVKDL